MTDDTNEVNTKFFLIPMCCVCLETNENDLCPLDTRDKENISYTYKLAFCFPEKVNKLDNSILRHICKDCTPVVTLAYKFKLLYYRNTAVREKHLKVFENINNSEFSNLLVTIEDVKPLLSPENTVKFKRYDPKDGNIVMEYHTIYFHENIEHNFIIEQQIFDYEELQFAEKEDQDNFLGFPSTEMRCISCNVPPENKRILLNELAEISPRKDVSKNQHTCEICNKSYSSLSSLKSHNHRVHKHRYPCEMCKSRFVLLENLEQHIKNHNPQLKCPICPKLLTTTRYLRKHMKTKHRFNKCGRCKQLHPSEENCQTTVTIATIKCQNCDKTITNGEQHNCVAIATAKCQICHVEVVDGVRHVCDEFETCKRCYHVMTEESGEHECKSFKCVFCRKEFLQRTYLIGHLRLSHRDPKKYKCNYCFQEFYKHELAKHLKEH